MAYCDACNDLMQNASEFVLNGITDKICESLTKNEGLNPDLPTLHTNCEDLKKVVDCLVGAFGEKIKGADPCDWKKYVGDLVDNLYITLKAMGCSDCGQWLAIDDLYRRVDELRVMLEALLGARYLRLTKDVDYELAFFNGFEGAIVNDIYVGVIAMGDRVQLRMSSGPTDDYLLKNLALINVDMAHSSPIASVPKARIYGIKFKGDYAYLNDYIYVPGQSHSTGIWNVRPTSLRASWQATIWEYPDTQGFKILTGISSYADGYNTQFSIYGDNSIHSGGINHSIDAVLVKP